MRYCILVILFLTVSMVFGGRKKAVDDNVLASKSNLSEFGGIKYV